MVPLPLPLLLLLHLCRELLVLLLPNGGLSVEQIDLGLRRQEVLQGKLQLEVEVGTGKEQEQNGRIYNLL